MSRRLETWLTRTTGVRYPFIQGGMMHVGLAELVASVTNAGALGFITAFSLKTPEDLRKEIQRCRELVGTKKFGVNFTLLPSINPPDYPAYAKVAVEEGITIFETAGNPTPVLSILRSVKDAVHIHKVISIAHALKAQSLGVSAVTIDGCECAGHPGEDEIGSMVLLARAAQVLTIPFIASGGFADGRGIAAALALGAEGVNMGSRWLCTKESPIAAEIKRTIVAASEKDTSVLLKPLNNSVRCYSNKISAAVLEAQNKPNFSFGDVANLMSGARGVQVFQRGDPDYGIWSLGQSAGLIHDIPDCASLVARLEEEVIAALDRSNSKIASVPRL